MDLPEIEEAVYQKLDVGSRKSEVGFTELLLEPSKQKKPLKLKIRNISGDETIRVFE